MHYIGQTIDNGVKFLYFVRSLLPSKSPILTKYWWVPLILPVLIKIKIKTQKLKQYRFFELLMTQGLCGTYPGTCIRCTKCDNECTVPVHPVHD